MNLYIQVSKLVSYTYPSMTLSFSCATVIHLRIIYFNILYHLVSTYQSIWRFYAFFRQEIVGPIWIWLLIGAPVRPFAPLPPVLRESAYLFSPMSLVPPDPAAAVPKEAEIAVCGPEHCFHAFDALYCALTRNKPVSPNFPNDK
jgi:hypothetical protein